MTKLPELQAKRKLYADAQTSPDPDAFPPVRREKPPKRGPGPDPAQGQGGAASCGRRDQRGAPGPPGAGAGRAAPEARLAAMDAKWWMIAQFDSAVVSMPDGASAAWYRRDKDEFGDLLRRTVDIHQRLYREWPALACRYRRSLPDIVSPEQWAKTFEAASPDATTDRERS